MRAQEKPPTPTEQNPVPWVPDDWTICVAPGGLEYSLYFRGALVAYYPALKAAVSAMSRRCTYDHII